MAYYAPYLVAVYFIAIRVKSFWNKEGTFASTSVDNIQNCKDGSDGEISPKTHYVFQTTGIMYGFADLVRKYNENPVLLFT
jgi:hypothetical protein